MNPPGAPMSGLRVRSGDGPNELKLEMRLPVETEVFESSGVQVRIAPPARIRLKIARPSSAVTATTGMVIGGAPGMTVAERNPGALLYRTTADAPASCAAFAFM